MIIRNILNKTNNLFINKRYFTDKNVLSLYNRGFFQEIFPDNAGSQIKQLFLKSPQTVYAGFDPTADSLHVGNLLVIMGLLHCNRAGHQSIALLGGATGQIGDPSGRKTERSKLGETVLENNLNSIEKQIKTVFQNHEEFFWNKSKPLQEVRIVNNAEWYKNINLIEFISQIGRHFRMGNMMSRTSVQSRLTSESGMSFTEFTYQIFQSYDWYHLYKEFNCKFQLGGSDQMGNLMSGHELISRIENKPVFGLTLPLVTTEEGDKFGKSAGNAIWLCPEKTSPFSFYQFFLRVSDTGVEKLLKLFTFLPIDEIKQIMVAHEKSPEKRDAQRKLAQEVTMLVHGEKGLELAETVTSALYQGSVEALGKLSTSEIAQTFSGATFLEFPLEAGMTVLQVALKANCFPTENDAIRIITAGGFYLNQSRTKNISEVVSPGVHILKNGLTIIRVGKKNYYIVKWL